MKNLAYALIVVVLSTVACACAANPKILTRAKAAELINKSEGFQKPVTVKVPVGDIWCDWRQVNDLKKKYHIDRLVREGIMSFQDIGKNQGMWNKEYVTSLTVKGIQIAKYWTPTKAEMPNWASYFDPNYCYDSASQKKVDCGRTTGVVYSVVLGHRKVKDVTGIAFAPGHMKAEVDFKWVGVPTPETQYFSNNPNNTPTISQQAELQLYDDGWRVIGIQ